MRRVTVCMAYYLNQGMMARQAEMFRSYPEEWRGAVRWIVVDDGSPRNPAKPLDSGVPLDVFRILVDRRWNQDSAKNIAAHEAPDGSWLLLTDMDHLIPPETMKRVLFGPLDKGMIYKFGRVSAPKMTEYKSHPNSWCMSKRTYWAMGGYDERFSIAGGFYGTDSDFRDRVQAYLGGEAEVLPEHLIRVPRDVIPDASTTTYERKTDEDRDNIRRIKKERSKLIDQTPLTLTFDYVRVA